MSETTTVTAFNWGTGASLVDSARRNAVPPRRRGLGWAVEERSTRGAGSEQGRVQPMEPHNQLPAAEPYPVQLAVEYPDRQLNRLTTAFRVIVAIPILVVAASIGGGAPAGEAGHHASTVGVGAGGLLFLPPLLMIVFRQKYPRWWFDWNLELLRFSNRIGVYVGLLDDRYPSTDEQQSVALDLPY